MKRTLVSIFYAIFFCLFTLSCEKAEVGVFDGSYTYKISGSVSYVPTSYQGKIDPVTTTLKTEQGQMSVATDKNGETVVTFDELLGEICRTNAAIKDGVMTLEKGEKNISPDIVLDYSVPVQFSGEGKLYEKVLIISLNYSGEFTVAGIPMTIVSSNVECVAKAND